MKKLFEESKAEIIRFGTDVIVTSTFDTAAAQEEGTGGGNDLDD